MYRACLACIILGLSWTSAWAGVARLKIDERAPVLEGRPFGHAGAYEKIHGTLFFEFDPASPLNASIVDLLRAPRNARGQVEAQADFMVLRPVDPALGSGTALLEVSNRGGKASLSYFNRAARGSDPKSPEQFGDGLLMKLGLTVIWVGWQFDVPDRAGLLRLTVPIATEGGRPIEGWVRADWTVDQATPVLKLAHRNHRAYPVVDPLDPSSRLTVRDGRTAERHEVPRDGWRFARLEGEKPVEDPTSIYSPQGFQAGKIYELVYRSQAPAVVGLGLAAIRDTISYAKYNPDCPFSVRKGIAFGVSQTGRFLRHFLYQGFNTDENRRQAFDGMLIQTAGGGRGSFNHRFAQPSRDGHRYSAFFYPTDIFPFSGVTQTDPRTVRSDGLLAHFHDARHLPKIFYTNTGYEYWGRSAALLHVNPDGSADVDPHPLERIYHLASGQHFVERRPVRMTTDLEAYRGNPLNFLLTLRALLVQLKDWVEKDKPPTPSHFPRLDQESLVSPEGLLFPALPGLPAPQVMQEAYRMDYGPRWGQGIVDRQPPLRGPAFPRLVPQVDSLGNEIGGLRSLEIQVPTATYTPWNLRSGLAGGNGELTDFRGTYVPLARTKEERKKAGDPRPSLEELYGDRSTYMQRVYAAAAALVRDRLLIPADAPTAVAAAAARWPE